MLLEVLEKVLLEIGGIIEGGDFVGGGVCLIGS